jgi:hypothetical protein
MAGCGKADKPHNRLNVDYKASRSAVFPALIQWQSRYFNGICQRIAGLGQDLHGLIVIAEDQKVTEAEEECVQGKAAIDQANSAEMDLIPVLKTLENQAGMLETLVARVLRVVVTSQQDASEYFFHFQIALERETIALQAKATKMVNSIPGFSGVLIWEDTNSPTAIRTFKEKPASSNRSKQPERAEIHYSQGLKTDFCKDLSPPLLRCPKDIDQCRTITHIDHVFANAAKCLSNVRNLEQVLLYMKLHLVSLAKVWDGLLEDLRLKLQLYSSQKEHGQLLKLKLASDKDLFATFERLKELADAIASEGSKLSSHIEHLPEQLAYSARTCLPVDSDQHLAALLRENRLKTLASACVRMRNDLAELMEEGERGKRGAGQRRSTRELLKAESGSELLESGEYRRTLQGDSRSEQLLYRFYHLKSMLLKQYQPQRLIQRLIKRRSNLEDLLLRLLSGKQPDLAANVAAIGTFPLRFTNPAIPALDSSGHSYESSWDLEVGPLQSYAQSHCSISTAGHPEQWSESELTGSVESLSQLIPEDSKKITLTGLKGVYYPVEKIENRQKLAKNMLNKQTKAVYQAGIEGWKQRLKDLTASEVQLRQNLAKKKETPWQECLSPVFPAQSSPISSCLSYLSRSLTPSKASSKPTFRSSTRPKGQIDESLAVIESKTSHIALEKLSKNRNLSAVIRSTATGRRLEQEITKELKRLAPAPDKEVGRQLSATVHRPSHYLKHRLRLVQRDRSLSPFDKIKCVREEFQRYYDTLKRPILRPTKH